MLAKLCISYDRIWLVYRSTIRTHRLWNESVHKSSVLNNRCVMKLQLIVWDALSRITKCLHESASKQASKQNQLENISLKCELTWTSIIENDLLDLAKISHSAAIQIVRDLANTQFIPNSLRTVSSVIYTIQLLFGDNLKLKTNTHLKSVGRNLCC